MSLADELEEGDDRHIWAIGWMLWVAGVNSESWRHLEAEIREYSMVKGTESVENPQSFQASKRLRPIFDWTLRLQSRITQSVANRSCRTLAILVVLQSHLVPQEEAG